MMYDDEFEVLEEIQQKRAKSRKNLSRVLNNRRYSKFDLDEVMIDEISMEA
jgi:hypothetical protein